MDGACAVCGKAISGSDVIYSADARMICAACSANADLAATSQRAFDAALGVISAGAAIGAVPFLVHISTSSVVTVNGVVTGASYRDWLAVTCGVVAVVVGAAGAFKARARHNRGHLVLGILVVALGGYQVARGLGAFEPSYAAPSEGVRVAVVTPAPAQDPDKPESCPDKDTCFALGEELDKAKDEDGGYTAYVRACDFGERLGCYNAGLYWRRANAPKDSVKAAALYKKACDLGEGDACSNLGFLYETGDGVTQDSAKAVEMYASACGAKSATGCRNLGVRYRVGDGVAADPAQAFAMMMKACDLGDDAPDACDVAGVALLRGRGTDADPGRAVKYFTKACDLDAKRCTNLGNAYIEGQGVAMDAAKARAVYERGCDAGAGAACGYLGDLVQRGVGGPKDVKTAKELFQKACDAGVGQHCRK